MFHYTVSQEVQGILVGCAVYSAEDPGALVQPLPLPVLDLGELWLIDLHDVPFPANLLKFGFRAASDFSLPNLPAQHQYKPRNNARGKYNKFYSI